RRDRSGANSAERGKQARMLKVLQQDLARAEAEGAYGRVAELREICRMMEGSPDDPGPGPGGRQETREWKKRRGAVCNALRDALKKLRDNFPALGRHLESALTVGPECCYDPNPAVAWEL